MKVHIPTPLRPYAGKSATVEVRGKTVAEALANVTAQHGELRHHLYTDEGKLRAFVNVYVNDEDIRHMQKENTPLSEEDSISIVPSIAGGSCADGHCYAQGERFSPGIVILSEALLFSPSEGSGRADLRPCAKSAHPNWN